MTTNWASASTTAPIIKPISISSSSRLLASRG
jgi:hypothetical protein